MKYLFTTIIGVFVFDNQFNLVEHIKFNNIKDYEKKQKAEEKVRKKYKNIKPTPKEKIPLALEFLKKPEFMKQFYSQNLALTKKLVRSSINPDNLIIQTISNTDELDKTVNMLVKRLREWYSLSLPEAAHAITDNEAFVAVITTKTRKEILKELKLSETMGTELSKNDLNEINVLATEVNHLIQLRNKHTEYLKNVLKPHCPNLLELCGATIAAKLIELAGSLKRLALLPSSTIQLLGAEKALFRHLVKKTKPPKHGIIHEHPLIQKVKKTDKGKAARSLADKISFSARLDYFKGEFKAKQMKKELEEKFK